MSLIQLLKFRKVETGPTNDKARGSDGRVRLARESYCLPLLLGRSNTGFIYHPGMRGLKVGRIK